MTRGGRKLVEEKMESFLSKIEKDLKTEFDRTNRILTFDEYMNLVGQNPTLHTRGSAQLMLDMMNFFGKEKDHFKLFDMEFEDPRHKVIAQNEVQQELYSALQNYVKEGVNNKLLLLHGPNGSAKSSLINCMIRGLEHYSEQPEGALYHFNWIFPVEKYLKGSMGLGTYANSPKSTIDSYANLPESEISAKISCELKDHPLLLIPTSSRNELFSKFFEDAHSTKPNLPDYLTKGSLCHKCKLIFEALLTSYKGDFKKVLMHIQVERLYVSKRYRSCVTTIEPQLHVDAQYRQITMDKSLQFLPPSLQSLSLFELSGDLIDGNRGLIEFADLLKRPVDTFKYLLIACEAGAINVGSSIASLDVVLIGTTNEIQLDAFKEFPDFTSFKARIELIRVPYLLEYSQEKKIYDIQIDKIAGPKHIAPHTTFVAALWSVLTRLKKPNAIHYATNLSNIVGDLTPHEKSKLYDHAGMPVQLTSEEKKILRSSIKKLREEYNNVPYFEGRLGASAREIKSILYEAAQNPEFECVSPFAILKELEDFIKRVSEYEFLKQDIKDGYHDCAEFIQTTKKEYITILDQEVRESMGVFETKQYNNFLKKYILHLSHFLKKEKIKNIITGALEDPDLTLIEEFEKIIDSPQGGQEQESYRNNIISTIGAYSLDHPRGPVDYPLVFPEFMRKLEDHYFEQQKNLMSKISSALLMFGTDKEDKTTDHYRLTKQTIQTMIQKYNYCESCAKQAITFLIKARY